MKQFCRSSHCLFSHAASGVVSASMTALTSSTSRYLGRQRIDQAKELRFPSVQDVAGLRLAQPEDAVDFIDDAPVQGDAAVIEDDQPVA